MAPGSQPILSSAPLQVLFYLNSWYFAAFYLAEILMFVYKGGTRRSASLPGRQPGPGRGPAGDLPRSGDAPHLLRLEGEPVRALPGLVRGAPGPPPVCGAGRLLPAAADLRPAAGVHPQRRPALLLRPGAPARTALHLGLLQVQSVLKKKEV